MRIIIFFTLAAIARELNIAKIYSADVLIAAGLPLTWVSEQREEFKRYFLKNETIDFNFKGKDYHIRIVGADVYPQGFAAIVNHLSDFFRCKYALRYWQRHDEYYVRQ